MPRSIRDLPGPRGLPLIGVAHRMRVATFHQILEDWCERYGPTYAFKLGSGRVVVTAEADAVNRALRERPDGFRRTHGIESVTRELIGTIGVFAAEGAEWRQQRRLAVTALNSNHLERYYEIVRTCSERFCGRLERAAEEGGSHDIGCDLTSFTVDVTSALAFGHDLNTLEHGDGELQRNIQRIFDITGRRLTLPVPYWRWLRLPVDRAADRAVVAIRGAIDTFIAQARARMAARPELREEPENFLESMIAAQEQDNTFTDAEILGNVYTLLLAGEDTTAHTMAWTLWFLARHPEVQRRWAQEADEVLGDERFPSRYDTIAELSYGEAVLRESMRLKPVAPILGVEPIADTIIADTHIPAGTRLFAPTRLIGLRSVSRAREFDPDRWLSQDGLGDETPDQKSFLAFGAGPRFCPGRNLAFLESKAAMATIARNFHIELDESAGPVTENFQFTMAPSGLRVRLTKRSPQPPLPAQQPAHDDRVELAT
jgi:cytochrome P450